MGEMAICARLLIASGLTGRHRGFVQQGPSNAFETHMLLPCAMVFDRLTERTGGFEGIDRVQSQTTTKERFLWPNLRWVNL